QVATISHISPLLSEITSQDLDKLSVNYNANYKEVTDNSLSNKENNLNGDNFEYFENKQYRILLNAYPKKSFSKKPSKKSTDNKSQTIDLNDLQPGDQLLMTSTKDVGNYVSIFIKIGQGKLPQSSKQKQ